MPSSSNNGKKPQINQSPSQKKKQSRNRYKARAVKARRDSFSQYYTSQSVKSIGETSLTAINPPKSPPPSPVNPLNIFLNTIFRLTLVGVGIGTIFGTVLANLNLTQPLFPKLNLPFSVAVENKSTDSVTLNDNSDEIKSEESKNNISASSDSSFSYKNNDLVFSNELTSLKDKLVALKEKYPQLEAGAFLVDLDNGAYVNWNGITTFSAASTIKIPILVAFFQDVDEGKIYLDEKLTINQNVIGGGSGDFQYKPIGTTYTALATAREMIVNSDNTATNMIIERLGGKDQLNQRFKEWGLEATVINNPLPDLEGTNTTTARDLAILLAKVNQGQFVSLRSRDRLLDIMKETRTKTLLPEGIETGAVIAHKTGDIGTILGDAGIVGMTTGKRYIAAILVKRPHNDYSARTLIQEMSRTAYQHFKWYLPHPPLKSNTSTNQGT